VAIGHDLGDVGTIYIHVLWRKAKIHRNPENLYSEPRAKIENRMKPSIDGRLDTVGDSPLGGDKLLDFGEKL
jgi:hypothetical protein